MEAPGMQKDRTYKDDLDFMVRLLPDHYECKLKNHNIHCKSPIGIAEDQGLDDHWDLIVKAIQQEFGVRLLEIFHNTCTNHVDFTVYLVCIPEMERKLEAARKLAKSGILNN